MAGAPAVPCFVTLQTPGKMCLAAHTFGCDLWVGQIGEIFFHSVAVLALRPAVAQGAAVHEHDIGPSSTHQFWNFPYPCLQPLT